MVGRTGRATGHQAVAASVIAPSSSRVSWSSTACAESRIDSGRLAPGIGIITGLSDEQPRERDLLGRDAVRVGRGLDRVVAARRVGRVADPAERRPRQERDPALLAQRDLALVDRRPVLERQLVLHRDDVDDRARQLDLLDVRVGDPDPAHLALVLQLLERADRLLVRDVRVGAVVLVEVDPVGARARAATPRRPRGCAPAGRRAPTPRRCACGRPWWRRSRRRGGRAAPRRSAARRDRCRCGPAQ